MRLPESAEFATNSFVFGSGGRSVNYMMACDECGIRAEWSLGLAACMQLVAGRSETADPWIFAEGFAELARSVPNPIGLSERLCLNGHLREATARGGRIWAARYALPPGGPFDRLWRDLWQQWPQLDDARERVPLWCNEHRSLSARDPRLPPSVRAAVHIHGTIDRPFDVSGIAHAAACSLSSLTRSFVSVFGASPREFHRRVRARLAVKLLLTTDWKIDYVARAVGYRSTNNLYGALNDFPGLTPKAIRASGLPDLETFLWDFMPRTPGADQPARS